MATKIPTKAHPRLHMIALLVLFAVVLAACSSGAGSSTSADSAAGGSVASPTTTAAAAIMAEVVAADELGAEPPADYGPGSSPAPGLAVPTALTPNDIGRDIVFTASIDVEVIDVASAGAEARDTILALGGAVFAESTTTSGTPRSVLTFKVQPADFDKALKTLATIGELVNQRVSADDVTDRIVDLQSRLTTAEASVLRLRKLLDQAGDITALASLENQLLDRETLLEQLRGQLRTVKDQVALATITLTITQAATVIPPAAIEVIAGLDTDATDACPGSLDLRVDRNDTATLCVEIDNIGESALSAIQLESGSLRLRLNDFTVVEGNTERLEPGERLIVTAELAVEDGRVRRRGAIGGLLIDLRASAEPVGTSTGRIQASNSVVLDARNDTPLPGFADSFSAGASSLGYGASIAMIAFAGLLPFLPVLIALAILFWWRRRRRHSAEVSPPQEF